MLCRDAIRTKLGCRSNKLSKAAQTLSQSALFNGFWESSQSTNEILLRMEECKYLGILFTSEGKNGVRDWQPEWWTISCDLDSASVSQSASEKKRRNCKALSPPSVCVPTLTYGHRSPTERLRIQKGQISFFGRVTWTQSWAAAPPRWDGPGEAGRAFE